MGPEYPRSAAQGQRLRRQPPSSDQRAVRSDTYFSCPPTPCYGAAVSIAVPKMRQSTGGPPSSTDRTSRLRVWVPAAREPTLVSKRRCPRSNRVAGNRLPSSTKRTSRLITLGPPGNSKVKSPNPNWIAPPLDANDDIDLLSST